MVGSWNVRSGEDLGDDTLPPRPFMTGTQWPLMRTSGLVPKSTAAEFEYEPRHSTYIIKNTIF